MSTPDARTTSGPSAELGRLLVQLRTERGLAQKEVAHLANIDNSTLSRLESGERGVSRDVLDRICAVFDLERGDRLTVMVAAGFVTDEAALILADNDLARLARLLNDASVSAADADVLRQFVILALAHGAALGYEVD